MSYHPKRASRAKPPVYVPVLNREELLDAVPEFQLASIKGMNTKDIKVLLDIAAVGFHEKWKKEDLVLLARHAVYKSAYFVVVCLPDISNITRVRTQPTAMATEIIGAVLAALHTKGYMVEKPLLLTEEYSIVTQLSMQPLGTKFTLTGTYKPALPSAAPTSSTSASVAEPPKGTYFPTGTHYAARTAASRLSAAGASSSAAAAPTLSSAAAAATPDDDFVADPPSDKGEPATDEEAGDEEAGDEEGEEAGDEEGEDEEQDEEEEPEEPLRKQKTNPNTKSIFMIRRSFVLNNVLLS